jgi:hypothetical protein
MNEFDRTTYLHCFMSNIKNILMSFDCVGAVYSSRPKGYPALLPGDFATAEGACLLKIPRKMLEPGLVDLL